MTTVHSVQGTKPGDVSGDERSRGWTRTGLSSVLTPTLPSSAPRASDSLSVQLVGEGVWASGLF